MISKFGKFLSQSILLVEIVLYFILLLTTQILHVLQITVVWFDVTRYFLLNLLILLMVLHQIRRLDLSNIDGLSILILIFCRYEIINSEYSPALQKIAVVVNILSSLVFFIIVVKCKQKKIERLSIKQFAFFFIGLVLGLSIALLKISLNDSSLLNAAISYPLAFVSSLLFSLIIASEEFFFRGVLWGYLREKALNDHLIILITSAAWVLVHVTAYNNIPELINLFVLGIVFGYLTKFSKSINTSIGAHTGYSVFLVMQGIYFQP